MERGALWDELLRVCSHTLSHLDMGRDYQCPKACLALQGEINARWGRSCRDPRESQFNGGCSLSYPLGTLGRRRAGRDGGMSCLEAFMGRVGPGSSLPWQMGNTEDRKQSP